MDKKNDEFLKRLLETFKGEAQEHINALSSGLMSLEKASTAQKKKEIVEVIFREAHSFKGAARAVNLTDIETLCQSLENVFAALKNQEITSSTALLDLLHEAVDSLTKLLSAADGKTSSLEEATLLDLTKRLRVAATGVAKAGQEKETPTQDQPAAESKAPPADDETPVTDPEPSSPTMADTVRVSSARLNRILLQAEELFLAKLASKQRITELKELETALATWEKEWRKIHPRLQSIKHSLEKQEDGSASGNGSQLARLMEFIDWNESQVKQLESKIVEAAKSAESSTHSIELMVDNLLENTKSVMMVSFSTLLEAFPKMVRDLSRSRDKEIEFTIHGGEVEIDKRILEEMKDPLTHLVRNCVEHGIEMPAERKKANKPPKGTVTMAVAQKNSHIEISITDDGAGINIDNLKAAALKNGIVSKSKLKTMDDSDVLSLIFRSGISTSPIITEISGRGLGLAIVQEKVNKVGGTISFDTKADTGTTFRLVLPVTTATFRGVIVRVAEQLFILPTANVNRTISVSKKEIKTVENRQTIKFDGQVVSLVRLEDALRLDRKNPEDAVEDNLPSVVLYADEKHIAFLVDEVTSEQEVLVKSLGTQLLQVPNIAFATILSSGKVVPIINVHDLMKSAIEVSAGAVRPSISSQEKKSEEKASVMVVEDSITTRTLLKNILEMAGYKITTAVDGVDAFTKLRSDEFDIVVSDVDMPRMNGFDLTAKIRDDKKLADTPVILLTALESREDKERGIEVGANAYIVKGEFDQSSLLDVIRKLI